MTSNLRYYWRRERERSAWIINGTKKKYLPGTIYIRRFFFFFFFFFSLEPGIGQFREFEPRRVHTRTYKFVGTLSCA